MMDYLNRFISGYALSISLRLALGLTSFFALSLRLNAFDLDQLNDRILVNLPSTAQVGIIVKSVNDDKIVYEHNADRLFAPGSSIKILPAVVALKRLGPSFTYSTELSASSDFHNTSPENFYLKFSGDFSLTAKDLKKLFSTLTESNIHNIRGNIVYDISGYKIPEINSSWMLDDIDTCEMVPVSKGIIDENYYHFEICPGKTVSAPSILKSKFEVQPEYKIDNQVVTSLDKEHIWRSYGFIGDVLRIQGRAGINLKPQPIQLPIHNLDYYIQQKIAKALKDNGIKLTGKIVPGKIPQETVAIAVHKSAPLNMIIGHALKHTLNLPFGALLFELTSLDNPSATSWRAASKTLTKALFDYYSIDLSNTVIDDSIGVSRYNLMSPKQLSDVLIAAYKDPSISSYFVNGLAQNGKEGTLKKRLQEGPLLGKVYAKTGSLSGISALAGYLKTDKESLLAFVIFVNGFAGPAKPYRDFQDRICRILIEEL